MHCPDIPAKTFPAPDCKQYLEVEPWMILPTILLAILWWYFFIRITKK
jgi:hypothetical protein